VKRTQTAPVKLRFPAPFTGRKAAFVVAVLKRNRPGKDIEREGHRLMALTWAVCRAYERLTRPPGAGKLAGY
jgi:hypothetical protein